MKSLAKVLAIVVMCLGSSFVEAKSYGGGGRSSSFSSSSSRSSSSSSKSYSAPKAAPAPSKPSTATKQTSTRPVSKVEAARYEAASKSGKVFATRESAVADFKAKNANTNTYTSRYTTEPATRPAHIPTSYNDGGTRRDVVYAPNQGGYGYWSGGNGLGTFIMYDALSDAVMMNTLMSKDNYYVGKPPATQTVVQKDGTKPALIFLLIFGVIIICFFGFVMFK